MRFESVPVREGMKLFNSYEEMKKIREMKLSKAIIREKSLVMVLFYFRRKSVCY